jgi:Fe-S oxidoreductase
MLGAARRARERLAAALAGTQGPIVVAEPSCLSVFKDELGGGAVAERAVTLAQALGDARASHGGRVLLHGHCHQHATVGLDADAALLRGGGYAVTVLDAGCCGLAGAFGFTAGHEAVSTAIGEHRLAPAVRAAPGALVVADGFSCRTQIAHLTGRRAQHLAEVL